MHHLSMIQALWLWGELWQAYYGKNGFGGDTAEVYAYKLMPHTPMFDSSFNDVPSFELYRREKQEIAAYALLSLCEMFEVDHDATVTIDGMEIGEWYKGVHNGEIVFNHRVHIKVEAD